MDQGIIEWKRYIKLENDLVKLSSISFPQISTWLGTQKKWIKKFEWYNWYRIDVIQRARGDTCERDSELKRLEVRDWRHDIEYVMIKNLFGEREEINMSVSMMT